MKNEANVKSWIPTVKLTTLLYTLLVALAGGYIGAEYQALKSAAQVSPMKQETAHGYDTEGLANTANAYQFVDVPEKPTTTEGVY
jgi:hypothetical protein